MREVKLLQSAKADVVAAFRWYEGEQVGLGESFRRCVEAVLGSIARRPEAHPAITDRLRRAVVRRYPYIVVYEFDDTQVVVHAVFHTSQNPSKLRGRL